MHTSEASRLQLGTSRLETLNETVRRVFADKSWVHLGDATPHRMRAFVKRILGRAPSAKAIDQMYLSTTFQEFFFQKGDVLKFDDNQFGFIYSEHLFQHLDPELADELFKECYRVLKPGGVIRTCVPDADLRTYERPELIGFPVRLPPDHPLKHRSRWSVYSLTDALRKAGLRAVPLTYCTQDGRFVELAPPASEYENCVDRGMVMDTTYIMRKKSLIVDGIKAATTAG